MLPVHVLKAHHEGGGAPHDDPGEPGTKGYGCWLGPSRYTLLRSPDGTNSAGLPYEGQRDFSTLNLNGVVWSICFSGQRQDGIPGDPAHDVTATELVLVHGAVQEAVHRGWLTAFPTLSPHDNLAGSATACPGSRVYAVWDKVVAATQGATPAPPPEVHGMFIDMAPTPSGDGYYCVKEDGAVFAFGDAHYHGGANNLNLAAPICAVAVHPSNKGYWLFAKDGGVFGYGAVKDHGRPT